MILLVVLVKISILLIEIGNLPSAIKSYNSSLCSLESVYTVLNLLKKGNVEQCETKDFLLPFEKMIEYQVECILNPDNKNYRSNLSRGLIPKDRYKKSAQRSTIFEKEN